MNDREKQVYCGLLSDKIVSMFNVSKEDAVRAVNSPAIQMLIEEYSEYVDHTPLPSLAKDVYYLLLYGAKQYEEIDEHTKRMIDAINGIGLINVIPSQTLMDNITNELSDQTDSP